MNSNYWWHGNWRSNPCIQRSRNPLLKQAAIDLIEGYALRGDSIERIGAGMPGRGIPARDLGYSVTVTVGGYLIPGKTGVKVSTRQIGAMLEYEDGRVEWQVFSLEDIYRECREGAKPVQMRLFSL